MSGTVVVVPGLQHRLHRVGGGLAATNAAGPGGKQQPRLRQLPVDYIKIDGQFVRDCFHDGVNLAMVDSIHRIGRVMGLKTIAESVENELTLQRMREIGVDYCQGFYFGMPRPLLNLD